MASFCPSEVDQVPLDTCPFNDSHHLSSLDRFHSHIRSCRDQFFPGVSVHHCPHSSMHLFPSSEQLEYHSPRCASHPMRTPGGMYQVCPLTNRHLVAVTFDERQSRVNMEAHLKTCTKRREAESQRIAGNVCVPMTGVLVVRDPRIDADIANRLSQECVSLHFRETEFRAHYSLRQSAVSLDPHYYLDASLSDSCPQFPGLQRLTEAGAHRTHLAAVLSPDTTNPFNETAFRDLYSWFEGNAMFKMAICYQRCSQTDVVWIVAHPLETSGFGQAVKSGELGLFALRHSQLLAVPSTLEELSNRVQYLEASLNSTQSDLQQKSSSVQSVISAANERCADYLLRESQLREELARVRSDLAHQSTLSSSNKSQPAPLFDSRVKDLTAQVQSLQESKSETAEKLQSAEMQLRELEADRAVLQRNLSFLQNQYETSMRKAQNELMQVATQAKHMHAVNDKLAKRLRTAEKSLSQVKPASKQSLEPPIKRERDCIDPTKTLCRECGVNRKNTVNVPCGHMYSCNLCLQNRRVEVGQSLKFMEKNEDKMCRVCMREVRKIVFAYPYS